MNPLPTRPHRLSVALAPAVPAWLRRCVLVGLGCATATLQAAALELPAAAPSAAAPHPGTAAGDAQLLAARQALRPRDAATLLRVRDSLLASGHPLASWADYFELGQRLGDAQQPELDAFYARRPGSYVEDRLRNDWLLELGRRQDWANFRIEYPRFRMDDDRDVHCYALLVRHQDGEDVRAAALQAWLAQRDLDEGCRLMSQTLAADGVFRAADLWRKTRAAVEGLRPSSAQAAAALVSPAMGQAVADLYKQPERWLARQPALHELATLALMRLAARDPAAAAQQLDGGWQRRLSDEQAALAWAVVAKQAAMRQQPEAAEHSRRAWRLARDADGAEQTWGDELLAWQVRAALRLPADSPDRWALVQRAVQAMSADEQRDPAWVYWRARAEAARVEASSATGPAADARQQRVRQQFAAIASPLHFYGKLALDELGLPVTWPAPPQPPSALEAAEVRAHPGLARGLHLLALGLRSEGVREWNFSLRGLGERQLLAAAAWACEREVWDRCINTSDRTREQVNLQQRYPAPFRQAVKAQAREIGLDPAYMFGLIRQESRFISDARSHVGASGLMQLMPATARWTAKRIGVPYSAQQINDTAMNLRLGASYLKIVLDDFEGSQALAAAAYNAGPNRPRRWRDGPPMEPAAWAETIPFAETRDYVKKVLSNAVVYSALFELEAQTTPNAPAANAPGREGANPLVQRLGAPIAPRAQNAAGSDQAIP
jgi:soluble lytic murein transglycosylase